MAKGVSFAASLLALPAVYGFGRRRFDREVGLGAMAVLAVLPVHAIYAGFALRESLVALTSVARRLDADRGLVGPTPRDGLGLGGRRGRLARGWRSWRGTRRWRSMAGAGLYGLVAHGRRCLGPLVLWGVVLAGRDRPWAWVTYREYGQPFYSYTNYFQYNFSWTVHHYEKGITRAADFYTRANAPEIVRVKVKSVAIIAVTRR